MSTATLAVSVHHVIVAGPSLERIHDAAKYANDRLGAQIPLLFTTGSDTHLIGLRIDEVRTGAGSGRPLKISGQLNDGSRFAGHYDALTRSGYIEVTIR